MNRLKNKVAIVTGTGDGIGRGIALAFAKEGARLAICDLKVVELRENVTNIQKAKEAFDRLHPRGRVGSIEEVAAVFVFLASDEAANITATDIRCDGGYAARGQQPTS